MSNKKKSSHISKPGYTRWITANSEKSESGVRISVGSIAYTYTQIQFGNLEIHIFLYGQRAE